MTIYQDELRYELTRFYDQRTRASPQLAGLDELDSRYASFYVDLLSGQYRISRLFLTDTIRVIVLNLHGGIYCDFNDTICLYPMKYLLPLYHGTFCVGADSYPDQPTLRNNYFIYASHPSPNEFTLTSVQVINRAIDHYYHITSPQYLHRYMQLCLDSCYALSRQPDPAQWIPQLIKLPSLVELLANNYKTYSRVIGLMVAMMTEWELRTDGAATASRTNWPGSSSLDQGQIRAKRRQTGQRSCLSQCSVGDNFDAS